MGKRVVLSKVVDTRGLTIFYRAVLKGAEYSAQALGRANAAINRRGAAVNQGVVYQTATSAVGPHVVDMLEDGAESVRSGGLTHHMPPPTVSFVLLPHKVAVALSIGLGIQEPCMTSPQHPPFLLPPELWYTSESYYRDYCPNGG